MIRRFILRMRSFQTQGIGRRSIAYVSVRMSHCSPFSSVSTTRISTLWRGGLGANMPHCWSVWVVITQVLKASRPLTRKVETESFSGSSQKAIAVMW